MRTRIALSLGLVAAMLAGCGQDTVLSLEVGTCFDDVDELYEPGGGVPEVPIVDCDEPHHNEVYAVFDLPDGDFPADLTEQAIDGCIAPFSGYVGGAYETSRFDIAWLRPSPETWEEGDRQVICYLYDEDNQPIVGTARASGE
jgi:hypothetical protein